MNTKIIIASVLASTLIGCGEDKVTNNDPIMVRSAKMSSLCHGYYANLIDYLDDNGNIFNDQRNLKTIAEKINEVYEDSLDNFLNEGAITDKIIAEDMEKAKTAFATSSADAVKMYDSAHTPCGTNVTNILSPQDLSKLSDSWKED